MTHTIRSALWLLFFGGILVSWVMLYQMSVGMGLDFLGRPAMDMGGMENGVDIPMGEMPAPMDETGGMPMSELGAMGETAENGMPMGDMPMVGTDLQTGAMNGGGMDMAAMTRPGPLFGMWSLMMAAMMLPTLVPTLGTYERLIASADGTRAGWVGVLAGYSIVWIGVAGAFALAQIGLLRTGVIDMMGAARSPWIAGGLLIAVGAFQFSRAKEVCHGVCHAPMAYFLGHWRTGLLGGLRMGLALGLFCAGCCWGFMALGFAGGMMSLLWMGLATLFMVIEKLPEIGHHVTRPLGVALISGGLGVLAWPVVAG